MGDTEQEINLDEITDESLLQNLLDQTEDIDDRKAIRARIQELRAVDKAKRQEKHPTNVQSTNVQSTDKTNITERREESLQRRQKEAADQKQRTLAMYDHQAKSGPAGSDKKQDIGIYKTGDATIPAKPPGSISGVKASDGVEDALRERQKAAEERKKRMLAAYDAAARSAPAGGPREVNFEAFKKVDVSNYEPVKNENAATFGMSGGVAKVTKASSSQPGTPVSPGFPGGKGFPKSQVDGAEKIIRARQQEADERKARTLAAYDIIAKQGVGPKVVCLEEFRNINVKDVRLGTNYVASAGFSGGVSRV